MVRLSRKDATVDNEYIYCIAKLAKNAEVETFVNSSNVADLSRIGDRFYSEGLYESAWIVFNKLKSNGKIASCLIRLGEFSSALEFAKKASNIKTWREVAYACIEA